MAVKKKSPAPLCAEFSREELVILNNVLNEFCHGLPIDDDEFQTRIGYSRARAGKLLSKIAKVLK